MSTCSTKHETKTLFPLRISDFTLNESQRQVLYGSLLGDGNIKPNGLSGAYFRLGNTDKEYVEWKAQIMESLLNKGGIYLEKPRSEKWNQIYGFSTKTYQELLPYRSLYDAELLMKIDNLGFSIWCLDDGWYSNHSKVGNFCISCDRFSKHDFSIAIAVLKSRFNLDAKVIGNKRRAISINSRSNNKLKEVIFSAIPHNIGIVARKIIPLN